MIDSAVDLNDISLAFLRHKAKEFKKIILIIRPYYLSSKKGCVWSNYALTSNRKGCMKKSQSGVLKVTKTIAWIHSMYFDLEVDL